MLICSVAQSCPALCDPMNCSLPGSSVWEFSRQEYWGGLPCPPLGDFPHPGIKPTSITSPALAGRFFTTCIFRGFPGGSVVKNLPAMQETQVPSLGWEDPLEKQMATQYSILAWKIPWTEEPGRPQSTGSQRVGHNLVTRQQQYYLMQRPNSNFIKCPNST